MAEVKRRRRVTRKVNNFGTRLVNKAAGKVGAAGGAAVAAYLEEEVSEGAATVFKIGAVAGDLLMGLAGVDGTAAVVVQGASDGIVGAEVANQTRKALAKRREKIAAENRSAAKEEARTLLELDDTQPVKVG